MLWGNTDVWKSVGFRVCDKVMERVPTAAAQSCFPGVGKACAGFQGRLTIIIMLLASNKCFSSLSCSDITQQHVTGCWRDHPHPTGFGTGLSCLFGACPEPEAGWRFAWSCCPTGAGPGSWRGARHGLQGNSALPASKVAELWISALN